MLKEAGRLHIARELRHAPQRLAAVYTSEPMLGVRSWITANMKKDRVGAEEALCLWLNSTPGLLLRLCNANRPYLGRSALPHELMRTLPVLNIETLSNKQLRRACAIFSKLKDKSLKGFGELASDPVPTGTGPTTVCRSARPQRNGHDRQTRHGAQQRADDDG